MSFYSRFHIQSYSRRLSIFVLCIYLFNSSWARHRAWQLKHIYGGVGTSVYLVVSQLKLEAGAVPHSSPLIICHLNSNGSWQEVREISIRSSECEAS